MSAQDKKVVVLPLRFQSLTGGPETSGSLYTSTTFDVSILYRFAAIFVPDMVCWGSLSYLLLLKDGIFLFLSWMFGFTGSNCVAGCDPSRRPSLFCFLPLKDGILLFMFPL